MRLLDLYQLRVVDRFRPFTRSGSAPHHWILDEVGAQLIAWERGEDLKQLGWRRDRALSIAASRQLAHRLGESTPSSAPCCARRGDAPAAVSRRGCPSRG